MQKYCVRSALTPDVSKRMTGGCSEAGSTDGGPKLGREGREGEVPGAGSAMGDLLAVAGGSPEPDLGEGGLLADTGDTGSPCNPQNLNQAPAPQIPVLWAQPASCDTAARLLHRLGQSKFLVDLLCGKSLLQHCMLTCTWACWSPLAALHDDSHKERACFKPCMLTCNGACWSPLAALHDCCFSPQSSFCAHHMLAFLDTHTC